MRSPVVGRGEPPAVSRLGSPEPRIGTPPARELTPETSLGFDLIEFAAKIGRPLLPWQQTAAIRALELAPDGTYRFQKVLILVGRQCGKTTLLQVWALWRLYRDKADLVLGAAQSLTIAREAWAGSVELTTDGGQLERRVHKVRHTNGEQCLSLDSAFGPRYMITATTRGAGRGLTVDLLIMDEIREQRNWDAWSALSKTVIARPKGQIVCISNAGDDESVVLNRLQEQGAAGTDPTMCLLEWSAPDGCDLDDPDMWAMSLPAMGHTLTEDAIRSAISTDPPAVARTELLCQHVRSMDEALDPTGWAAGADPGGTIGSQMGRMVAALDVSVDGNHVALAVAAVLPDGKVRVEPVASWDSTTAARQELPGLLELIKPVAVAWYPDGPAIALSSVLGSLPKSKPLRGGDVTAACMGFADLVKAGLVVHNADALLDGQVATASKLQQGDGFRFTRRGTGNCDALYAVAGAVFVARAAKPRRGVFVL